MKEASAGPKGYRYSDNRMVLSNVRLIAYRLPYRPLQVVQDVWQPLPRVPDGHQTPR